MTTSLPGPCSLSWGMQGFATPEILQGKIPPLGSILDKKSYLHRQTQLSLRTFATQSISQWFQADLGTPTPAQQINLAKTTQPLTRYIITGQQPGLLGGPALWVYKALTAIHLASQLEERFQQPIVPVFWIADDDSDWGEVNLVEWVSSESGYQAHRFGPASRQHTLMLAHRQLGIECEDLLYKLNLTANSTLGNLIKKILAPKLTYGESFHLLFQEILGQLGCLVLHGASRSYQTLAQPILQQIALDFPRLWKSHTHRIQQIQSLGFPVQVVWQEGVLPMYVVEDGHRVRPQVGEPVHGKLLSHDGLSRMVVLDQLLPVLGYVLGPAEFNYFYQVSSLIENYVQEVPLVYPRMTSVYIPKSLRIGCHKLGLSDEDVLNLSPSNIKKMVRERLMLKSNFPSKELESEGQIWLENIFKQIPADFEPQKFQYLRHDFARMLEKLKDRAEVQLLRSWEPKLKPFYHQLSWLQWGKFQDRHLSILSLLNYLGEEKFHLWLKKLKPQDIVVQWHLEN